MLIFVGLGYTLKHLTREALEALENADVIYVDTYTSMYEDPLIRLEELNPKAIIVHAKREDLEGPAVKRLLEEAKVKNIIVAVPGDPFIATTHDAIYIEALKRGIEVRVINGISFITMAYSRLGLQSYRFGKHVTLVYPTHFKPYSTIEFIYDNLSRNLHTIVLLDFKAEESRAMTIPEAVDILLELDYKNQLGDRIALGVARLGWRTEKICVDTLRELGRHSYPPPPHSVVIPARLDPVEEEFVNYWSKKCLS